MPKLSQMYPSKYLQAEDLPQGNSVVTIEAVYPAQAQDRSGSGDVSVKWMLRFREFRKPMTLWQSNAKMISQVLNTDDTDGWIGKRIAIYPATYVSFGEVKPCINVDKWLPEQIAPAQRSAPALVISHDKRPIPRAAMDRFLQHVRAAGKNWDDFLKWGKRSDPAILEMAFGVPLDLVPSGLLPAMKAYLDSLAAGAAATTAPTASIAPTGQAVALQSAPREVREVIDAATGEVMNTGAHVGGHDVVPDDEIPF